MGKEPHAKRFDLITANARRNLGPGAVKVSIDFRGYKGVHGQTGDAHLPPNRATILDKNRGRQELMRAALQAHQLRVGFVTVGGLSKNLGPYCEDLVASKDEGTGRATSSAKCLHLGQCIGDVAWRRAFLGKGGAHRLFINGDGADIERDAGIAQKPGPDRGAGSEDERIGHVDKPVVR